MSDSTAFREKSYCCYLQFLEVAERKRRWNVFDDIPWERIDPHHNNSLKARRLETFCMEELYVPDYGALGLALTRSQPGLAWFQMSWTSEEARHGLALREYLRRSGMRSESEIATLETTVLAAPWKLPFATSRQMACYGALQESATYLAYRAQKERAQDEGDHALEAIFALLSRDEAAHAGFYRTLIQLEMEEDRPGAVADLAKVIAEFKMPGDGLIPEYQERLRSTGAGISPRTFVEHTLLPLLKLLKISRVELREVTRTNQLAARSDPTG